MTAAPRGLGTPAIRCMGAQVHRWQCALCKRLPRAVEDEEADRWLNHAAFAGEAGRPCRHFLPLHPAGDATGGNGDGTTGR